MVSLLPLLWPRIARGCDRPRAGPSQSCNAGNCTANASVQAGSRATKLAPRKLGDLPPAKPTRRSTERRRLRSPVVVKYNVGAK